MADVVEMKPAQEKQETEPKSEVKVEVVEKVGVFKRVGRTLMKPIRYIGRKLKESPAAAAIGAVGGAGLALGGKILFEHYIAKGSAEENQETEEPTTDDYTDDSTTDEYIDEQ